MRYPLNGLGPRIIFSCAQQLFSPVAKTRQEYVKKRSLTMETVIKIVCTNTSTAEWLASYFDRVFSRDRKIRNLQLMVA